MVGNHVGPVVDFPKWLGVSNCADSWTPLAVEMSKTQKADSPQENERNPTLTVKTPLLEERDCRKGLRRCCNNKKFLNPPLLKERLTSFTLSSHIPQLDGEN